MGCGSAGYDAATPSRLTQEIGTIDAGPNSAGKRAAPQICIEKELRVVRECFVEFDGPAGERIRFRVNLLKNGRFTFSDPREQTTGTAGTTGMWGTLPRPGWPGRDRWPRRAFKLEAARLHRKREGRGVVAGNHGVID